MRTALVLVLASLLAVAGFVLVTGCRRQTVQPEMLALILENADACRRAGEQWRSEEEVQAIERSLALQLRQLDRDRQPSVTRLFVAESALCNLVLHPEGSTLAFDAERNRLLSEFEAAKTSLRLELGPEPFKAEISQSFKTVIARPAHAQEGAGTP